MKSLRITRSCSLALLLTVSGISGLMASTSQGSLQAASSTLATSTSHEQLVGGTGQFTPADDQGRYVFLIEFNEPGLLDRHRQSRQQSERFNFSASNIQTEASLMASRHEGYVSQMSADLRRDLNVSHYFQITHSGIAARLTAQEARQVLAMPEVASVERERLYQIETFAGPEFIGAGSIWDGSTTPDGQAYRGEGMIAAVLDSGIVPNHPSFANDPACGHGQNGAPDKLISFVDCLSTGAGGICNGSDPIDSNGHGTHVAGTVAGNLIGPEVTPAPNPSSGSTISGVAYCAHIRNYKVCPGQSCNGAAIQAAMNNILIDGDVDTMNFSISGGTSPWNDNDRRKLDLVDAGVFVNASAGNTNATITNPVGAVGHIGPWVTSVAASTRPDGAAGVLSMTGPGTVPGNLQGIVMDRGSDSPAGPAFTGEIRYDADQPAGADGCVGFPTDFFDNAIALVQRGTCPFTDKINNAAAAGAQVVVIWNNAAGTISMGTAGQVNVPAYSITQAQGQAFIDFIDANPGATAALTLEAGAGGDVLAGFSLRGPTRSPFVNLQKPDITAPGVGIYAADVTASGYGNKSGTSMSGPHLSGAAVLVRQMQPDWAPIEVGSALRMTAKKSGFKEGGANAWDWDDVGSGRVELTRAALAGMVMDETFANFLAANPATGGDLRTLNLPAVRDVDCSPSCTFSRTLRNTLDVPTSWSIDSEVISGDFNVTVSPSSFNFSGDLSETQTVEITLAPSGTLPLSFGTIDFVEDDGLSPDLHFTVALAGTGDGAPEPEGVTGFDFEGTVSGITGDPEGVWASDLQMNITGPSGSSFVVGGFATGNPAWDFDGAGSDTDGTYNSSHSTAFLPGTDLDGDWTITFTHTFAQGASMTWDPITIELTGPGRNVLAVINVPPFTINGGASNSFTIPVSDDGPSEPEIAVAPGALSATVGLDGTASSDLTISNLGTGTLLWEIEQELASIRLGLALDGSSTATASPQGSGNAIELSVDDGTGENSIGVGGAQFIWLNRFTPDTNLASITIDSVEVMFGYLNEQGGIETGGINVGELVDIYLYEDADGNPANGATHRASLTDQAIQAVDGVTWSVFDLESPVTFTNPGDILIGVVNRTAGVTPSTFPAASDQNSVSQQRSWAGFGAVPGDPPVLPLPTFGIIDSFGAQFAGNWMVRGFGTAEPACENLADVSWLDASPSAGSTEAGENASVTVSFDADGLAAGTYEARLCISSNDANNPLVIVPVSLEVLAESAALQVAHLAPFADDLADTEVDVALSGNVVLSNVPYGASTGALTVPAGTYDVQILLAGTSTVALEALGAQLEDGVKYTAIASGDDDNQPLALNLLVDDLSAPAAGNFKLRLGHLAPFASGAASAEVRLADGTLIESVDYGDIGSFTELPAGSYNLIITAPGGDPILIDPIELSFSAGDIISAFAVGDGVNQPLGAYALPPTAPGFFIPLDVELSVLEGTVSSLGYCSSNPFAAAGALIEVEGDSGTIYTATADAAGFYQLELTTIESPVSVTASAPDHISATETGVVLIVDDTVVVDFDLVLEAACATVEPGSLSVGLLPDQTAAESIEIGNLQGAADLVWTVFTEEVGSRAHFPEVPYFVAPGMTEGASALADESATHGGGSLSFEFPLGTALEAFSTTGFTADGYVSLDPLVPGTLNLINATQPTNIFAATFIDNDFSRQYMLASADGTVPANTFGFADTDTGVFTALGLVTGGGAGSWSSMKWDHGTGTLYAVNAAGGNNVLYTIDPDSLVASQVGVISGAGVDPGAIVIAIAISPNGLMYGIDIIADALLAVDKETAEAAVIGALGVNANFAQDMDFDNSDGTLYWAGYLGGGNSQMFTVDLSTGAATAIGNIGGGNELLSFTIASQGAGGACQAPSSISWMTVDPTAGTTEAGSTDTIDVLFDSTGLSNGVYEAFVCIETNDANNAQIAVPVSLNVVVDELFQDRFEQ